MNPPRGTNTAYSAFLVATPYAAQIARVHRHWSGNHHAIGDGIELSTLLWTDGDQLIPMDVRLDDKPNDGITKNEHFRAIVLTAQERDFTLECVRFDQ